MSLKRGQVALSLCKQLKAVKDSMLGLGSYHHKLVGKKTELRKPRSPQAEEEMPVS